MILARPCDSAPLRILKILSQKIIEVIIIMFYMFICDLVLNI